MTLQKNALALAAIIYIAPVNNPAFSNSGYAFQNKVITDTPFVCNPRPEVKPLADSVENPPVSTTLVKPQIAMNAKAAKFVSSYLKKNEEDLKEVAKRSDHAFSIMEPILKKHQVPAQLKYLAVVESDLKWNARSKVGATGAWQLMKVTAKELGLKVNGKTDERKSYHKSTVAAAKYLKALYNEYEDWLLVIAAYNCGPGVVNSAIKKSGSRNFWKLQLFLPAETRGHVKRYIGVHYFFENSVSETTLTKAENLAYTKELKKYQDALQTISTATDTTEIAAVNMATDVK